MRLQTVSRIGLGFVAGLVLAATGAMAGTLEGTWASTPDRKGQTGHVVISKCGSGLCGKIVRAYDSAGNQITTKNVGKRVLWDMKPNGAGAYEGRVYVPVAGRDFRGKLTPKGANTLNVQGCAGVLGCRSQTWTRVK